MNRQEEPTDEEYRAAAALIGELTAHLNIESWVNCFKKERALDVDEESPDADFSDITAEGVDLALCYAIEVLQS